MFFLRVFVYRVLCTIFIITTMVGLAAAQVSSTGLARWDFNEGSGGVALDRVGPHDASLVGGAGWSTSGRFGGAGTFDGVTGSVCVTAGGDVPVLDKGSFTVMAWVNWDDSRPEGNVAALVEPSGWALGGKQFGLSGGRVLFDVFGFGTLQSQDVVPQNAWHHLAWVYEEDVPTAGASLLRVYIDGSLQNQLQMSERMPDDAANQVFTIGGRHSSDSLHFSGMIDEVQVFSGALTDADIRRHGLNLPLAWWTMNEAEGEEARDHESDFSAVTGEGTSWRSMGKQGAALDFNGTAGTTSTTSWIRNSRDLYFDRGNFTLMAWVKREAGSGSSRIFMKSDKDAWLSGARQFGFLNGQVLFDAYGHNTSNGNTVVPTGEWHHIAAVYRSNWPTDGFSTVDLYLDGVADGSHQVDKLIPGDQDGYRMAFGGWLVPAQAYVGGLDEFRFYDRAMTGAEIAAAAEQTRPAELALYVSTEGNDSLDGLSPIVGSGISGPKASLTGARNAIRNLGGLTQPVTVYVRGGLYAQSLTLDLGPQDSGTWEYPITYKAYPGETPVISGGREITGLTHVGGGLYQTSVLMAINQSWKFRQLFINGERYTMARTPNEGYFYVEGIPPEPGGSYYGEPYWASHNFNFREGDLKAWPEIADLEVNLRMFSLWEAQTILLRSVDDAANHAVTETHVLWTMEPTDALSAGGRSKRYYVENAPDALDAPGEWYLNRTTGLLRVYAQDGADLSGAQVIAPVGRDYALRIIGDADNGDFVENLHFEGLKFRHWATPDLNGGINGGYRSNQGARTVDGTIQLDGARNIDFLDCEVGHSGKYGLRAGRGVQHLRMERLHAHDLGAGAVGVGETVDNPSDYDPGELADTRFVTIYNSHLHDGGQVMEAGLAILLGQASDCILSHNHIEFFKQIGIQLGWTWDQTDTWSKRNRVEHNYLHDIGQNVLSDLGAIYTVGQLDGTVIRYNKAHDIFSWMQRSAHAFYPDQETDGTTWLGNIGFETTSFSFGINFARNMTVRNNILSNSYGRAVYNVGFRSSAVIENNIFYHPWGNAFATKKSTDLPTSTFVSSDHNVFWRWGRPERFQSVDLTQRWSLSQWRGATGLEANSVEADPLFVDPENGDYSLAAESPAWALGFQPIEEDLIGLEGPAGWVNEQWRYLRPPVDYEPFMEYSGVDSEKFFYLEGIWMDFEDQEAGATATRSLTTEGAVSRVRVDSGPDAAPNRSLHFQNATGETSEWLLDQYDEIWHAGPLRMSFDLYLEPGAALALSSGATDGGAGPSMGIANGQWTVGGSPRGTLPSGEWIAFEFLFEVGTGNGNWSVAARFDSGTPPIEVGPLSGAALSDLDWILFSSPSGATGDFFVDHVYLRDVDGFPPQLVMDQVLFMPPGQAAVPVEGVARLGDVEDSLGDLQVALGNVPAGLRVDWVQVTSAGFVNLQIGTDSDARPGRYRLLLLARDSDGMETMRYLDLVIGDFPAWEVPPENTAANWVLY